MKKIQLSIILVLIIFCLSITVFAAQNQSPIAQVVKGGQTVVNSYTTIQEAFAAAKDQPDLSVRLLQDVQENAKVTGIVYLDLNGHDLQGITISGTLYGMDSTTNNYNATQWGKLTPASGAPALHTYTTPSMTGVSKDYLRIQEGSSYSFHRFSIQITTGVIEVETTGIGYKTTYAGDAAVKAALAQENAFGMAVQLTPVSEDLTNTTYRSKNRDAFVSGAPFLQKLTISGVLSEDAIDNDLRGKTSVYARAYIRLQDGTVIFSKQANYNLKSMVELVSQRFSQYPNQQQSALDAMVKKYEKEIGNWNIAQIHHHDTDLWTPWTGTVEDGGHYYLTKDISLSNLITIEANTQVSICLNGHDIVSTPSRSRMLKIQGNLTLHDHEHTDGTFHGDVVSTYTGNSIGHVFYLYDNAVFNLCGGNLKMADGKMAGRGGVGTIGNGGTTSGLAQMNMYNGTISGGAVIYVLDDSGQIKSFMTGFGGNLDLNSHSELNMYGGVISGGTVYGMVNETTGENYQSTGRGGNISIASNCTFNMYGGIVEGGHAEGGNGGNIYNAGKLNIFGGIVRNGSAQCLTHNGSPVPQTGLGGGVYSNELPVTVCGNAVVNGNTGSNLYLGGFSTLNAENLSYGANIGISSDICGVLSQNQSAASYIHSDDPDFIVTAVNNKTVLAPAHIDTTAITKAENTFRAGYAMTDITPAEEGLTMSSFGNPQGRKSSGVNYRLYVTTIAVTDRTNNTFLLITMDMQNCNESFLATVVPAISNATGVPQSHIYISATHTHNCPSYSTSTPKNSRYRYLLIDRFVASAMEAMADRAPATMQTGSFDTVGMNYSRHYYYINENGEKIYFGDQFGVAPADKSLIRRVKEGDPTMHMLAFQRENKKDILLTNWRAHPHRSGGKTSYTLDSDVIGALREYMHTNTDYQFAYFQGAAGNMNTTSQISGETYAGKKITEYGNELGRQLRNGLAKLKPVETGLIQTKQVIYAANIDHSEDDRYEEAVALGELYKTLGPTDNQIEIANSYGFSSFFHASRLVTKYNMGATKNLQLNIFCIGDQVAFYTAPGELWDSVSEKIEADSPFDMTFTIGYSNGNVAYIPYQVDYSSYEYHYCLFTQDETINEMMAIYISAMEEMIANVSA